jgi:hypothetical protein
MYGKRERETGREREREKELSTDELMAMRNRKWGASNLNTGCDGDRFLCVHTETPSIRRCVNPVVIHIQLS